jgi:hypothetical protein
MRAEGGSGLTSRLQGLLEQEERLEGEVRRLEESLSGLRDIDLVLSLAAARLAVCVEVLRQPSTREQWGGRLARKAREALRLVESLQAENISEDQRGIVQSDPRYEEVRQRLQEFLLAGGAGLLEPEPASAKARRILSRTIVSAVRKYTGADDRYLPLDLEDYPPLVRKILLYLFPVFVRENPEQPPYGIDEGEELTYSSARMKLPLSQAIFYLENEVLPALEKSLGESPGDPGLQEEIRRTRERVEDYRKLRFFPRSTPVLLEKGYYTEGMTGYTVDGEMLVPVPLPVSFRSGTNLDRVMEQVRMEVVRRIAGRGVSREIDRQYRYLRSLESGMRGSSRTASMKLDAAWGYRVLRQEFPFLARLADKLKFVELAEQIRSAGGSAERRLESLMQSEPKGPLSPPEM